MYHLEKQIGPDTKLFQAFCTAPAEKNLPVVLHAEKKVNHKFSRGIDSKREGWSDFRTMSDQSARRVSNITVNV